MSLLVVVVGSAIILSVAYLTYGPVLSRLLRLRDDVPTPAMALRDDVDYVPIESKFLLSQHFSAIAAAGPIVGPILAGIWFGWGPALIWILVGSIFIGGVHDMTALVASIRHKARSIAEIVREHMTRRSYLLFLAFVWLALVYIIVAFTDITATSFIGKQKLENDQIITGGGVATSSLLYLVLPILMGLLLRYTPMSLNRATVIFVPLVGVAIWIGQYMPFSVENMFGMQEVEPRLAAARQQLNDVLPTEKLQIIDKIGPAELSLPELANAKSSLNRELKLSDEEKTSVLAVIDPPGNSPLKDYFRIRANSQRTWNVALLVYCVVASVVPMWLLLQPRGHLGGYFLYVALGGGMIGLMLGGGEIKYPAFTGWMSGPNSPSLVPLFPVLFITIACGACSGFHSIIASGTTSKQLRVEPDARTIGYGSMLLEAMVAIVSLCCVMMLADNSPDLKRGPNFLYANGIGEFLNVIWLPKALGISFGLMAFTTFVYDTLDVCTRLGRYIIQELMGWTGNLGKTMATALTAGVPLIFLMWQPTDESGRIVERWRIFWELFGASNQLLAALTLLGVTVWLWNTYRAKWVLLVTGLPCVFMYTMSMWALLRIVRPLFDYVLQIAQSQPITNSPWSNPVPWVATLLAALGGLILLEAVFVILGNFGPPTPVKPLPAPATT